MSIFNPSAWVRPPSIQFSTSFDLTWHLRSFWASMVPPFPLLLPPLFLPLPFSSAKDQLTGASVAIKKIMKPFSTPVLSKRTYRELKLLKHIQHENVRPSFPLSHLPFTAHQFSLLTRSSALATFSSLLWRTCASSHLLLSSLPSPPSRSAIL